MHESYEEFNLIPEEEIEAQKVAISGRLQDEVKKAEAENKPELIDAAVEVALQYVATAVESATKFATIRVLRELLEEAQSADHKMREMRGAEPEVVDSNDESNPFQMLTAKLDDLQSRAAA